METARVIGRGHVRVQGGYEAELSTGAVSAVIDTGKTLARVSESRRLSDAEKLALFDAGVAFMTLPPAFSPFLGVTYGLADSWEASLRYAGGGVRLGSRYQLLRREDGPFDLVVGLGVSRAVFDIPVSDVISQIKVDDFSRTSLDVPLLIGTSRSYFRVWGGPTFMLTHAETALRLELPGDTPVAATFGADVLVLGGQAGIAFGWKHLFFAFELTLARAMGSAHADVGALVGGVGHEVSLRSTLVQPTLGLVGEI
jgi:hypothetical protein